MQCAGSAEKTSKVSFFVIFGYICSRTVRVLFAMASGVPIVTEDFIHSSLEDGDCSLHCVADHLHPRFKMRVGAPKQLLDRCVFLGPCVDPPHNVVADLVKVLGAKNVVKTVCEADAVIIGE